MTLSRYFKSPTSKTLLSTYGNHLQAMEICDLKTLLTGINRAYRLEITGRTRTLPEVMKRPFTDARLESFVTSLDAEIRRTDELALLSMGLCDSLARRIPCTPNHSGE